MIKPGREIRRLGPEDGEEVRRIWRACFPEDSEEYVDWYFNARFDPLLSVGLFEGKLLSALQFAPYKLCLNGQAFDANFVVGASTTPDAQGKGLMAALLTETFAMSKRADSVFSTLYPFNYDFYRRFGYEVCSWRLDCSFYNAHGWKGPVREDVCGIDGADGNELGRRIRSAYEAMHSRFGLRLSLSADDCLNKLLGWLVDGGHAAAFASGAYALYELADGIVRCEDVAYESPQAFRALLERLPRGETRLGIPECDGRLLPESRSKRAPFGMLRVLDAEEALTAIWPVFGEREIAIVDEQCRWNTGRYRLEGGAAVKISDDAGQSALTPGKLTEIISGSVPGGAYFAEMY